MCVAWILSKTCVKKSMYILNKALYLYLSKMSCPICDWKFDGNCYYCDTCGAFSMTRPVEYTEDEEKETEIIQEEKCKHVWECLRGRCHNRGKGKYQAYKCKICNQFQRRWFKVRYPNSNNASPWTCPFCIECSHPFLNVFDLRMNHIFACLQWNSHHSMKNGSHSVTFQGYESFACMIRPIQCKNNGMEMWPWHQDHRWQIYWVHGCVRLSRIHYR